MDKNEAKKVFGENLKRLRLAKNMSQDELAKALGYTNRSSINKIELGKNDMPRNKITRAAVVLEVSPLEFFKEESKTAPTWTDTEKAEKMSRLTTAIFNGDISKLNEPNQARLMSYFQALLDTQEGTDEST